MTIHRKIHRNFFDVLHNHRMSNVVTDSTHVLGNTSDLICTNQPNTLCDVKIIISGLNDHSVIVAHLRHLVTSPMNQPRTIKLDRKADQEAF